MVGSGRAGSGERVPAVSNRSHTTHTSLDPLLPGRPLALNFPQQVLQSPTAPLEHPNSSCSSCCPLLSHYKAQGVPLQSCTWSFLTARQSVAEDFWSLPLPLLFLVHQVGVSVGFCLIISSFLPPFALKMSLTRQP